MVSLVLFESFIKVNNIWGCYLFNACWVWMPERGAINKALSQIVGTNDLQ